MKRIGVCFGMLVMGFVMGVTGLVVAPSGAEAAQFIKIDGSRRAGSSKMYRQRCEQSMARHRVQGNHAFLCAPINSPEALRCIDGALGSGVMNVNREHTDGCSWATHAGLIALDALYWNRYAFVRGSFIRFVGSTYSHAQAQCYANVFQRGYPQMDEFQLRSLCP